MHLRRNFILAVASTAVLPLPSLASGITRRFNPVAKLQALESNQARLGVCMLDTLTGEYSGYRMEEFFAFCSSIKLALVAAVLRLSDKHLLNLNEVLPYTQADLLPWAPVTKENAPKGGLKINELAQAAIEVSDGTAANLLIKRLGGPAGVTKQIRAMGDYHTRLDRYEPDLGLVLSADRRDTTTPLAYAGLVARIITGDILHPKSQQQMITWLQNAKTGYARLRAGLPASWHTGDKTGTGRTEGTTNKSNDVAITFPHGKMPIVIAAYYDSGEYTPQREPRHDAVLAEVGKIAALWAVSNKL